MINGRYEENIYYEIIYVLNENNKDKILFDRAFEKNFKGKLRIFGKIFVNNNKNNCKIIYKNKEYELKEYMEEIDKNYYSENIIKIKLYGTNNIDDMSYIFCDCNKLGSIKIKNDFIATEIDSIEYFSEDNSSLISCNQSNIEYNSINLYQGNNFSSLSISGINKDYISEITNDNEIYSNNDLLFNINVKNMSYMFSGCGSLISLPNISEWNTSNVTNMSHLFNGCNSLKSLPDISKWNTSNVVDMSSLFRGCKELVSLPDISK